MSFLLAEKIQKYPEVEEKVTELLDMLEPLQCDSDLAKEAGKVAIYEIDDLKDKFLKESVENEEEEE